MISLSETLAFEFTQKVSDEMSRCFYKIYLANITNRRCYLFSLTFNNTKKTLKSIKSRKLSLLCKWIIVQTLLRAFSSRVINGGGIVFSWQDQFIFNGFSHLVVELCERVCCRKECSPSFSSRLFPSAPSVALLLLARLIANSIFACRSTIQRGTVSSLSTQLIFIQMY